MSEKRYAVFPESMIAHRRRLEASMIAAVKPIVIRLPSRINAILDAEQDRHTQAPAVRGPIRRAWESAEEERFAIPPKQADHF